MTAGFLEELSSHSPAEMAARIQATAPEAVSQALGRQGPGRWEDFCALVSPAASSRLEALAQASHRRTVARFGRTVSLYAPLYLSNRCRNRCRYCGFNAGNRVVRRVLTPAEVEAEARLLKGQGFEHLLLVTGEDPTAYDVAELAATLDRLHPHFAALSLEVQPLATEEYRSLRQHHLLGVTCYQETYHRQRYDDLHPAGPKRDFAWRLSTPERLGQAGLHRIGLGVLLGLADWRVDAALLALHLAWLRKRFWRTRFSVSFPRLRSYQGTQVEPVPVLDRDLVQLICAFRLFDPDLDLVLSTREPAPFRDHALRLGITTMSAGSRTSPGGYGQSGDLEQFAVADHRSPAEFAAMLTAAGYQPVWKDWDDGLALH